MTIQEIKIGDGFWGIVDGRMELLRKSTQGIFIAGNWEGSINPDKIKFIQLVPKP